MTPVRQYRMFDPRRLKDSFFYAGRGIVKVAREEQNFRIELLAAVAVIVGMRLLRVGVAGQAVLMLAIALVLVLELMNSIFERMVDIMKPRIHHYVEDIKDIMAGSVLVAAAGAAVVGALVFWEPVMVFITSRGSV